MYQSNSNMHTFIVEFIVRQSLSFIAHFSCPEMSALIKLQFTEGLTTVELTYLWILS